MKNTKDLREKVTPLLREALHGRTVDMMQSVEPELPHMLGYTEIGVTHDLSSEAGTLLDPSHAFWDDYYRDVETGEDAREEVITAVESLRADGTFQLSYPYGEEGGIAYIEVLDPKESRVQGSKETYKLPCENCDQTLRTSPSLVLYSSYCKLKVSVDCGECGFTGTYSRKLVKE